MEITLEKLLSRAESESLDFKRQYHDNNVKLVHDILCLANSYAETDRYLVFGVDNSQKVFGVEADTNRKTNANFQDLLRQSYFNRIPNVRLEVVKHSGKEVDILTIRNRPDKPFFLIEDKSYKGTIIRSGVIYTRLGDTNTPLLKTASDDQIELMWHERFGLGLTPFEHMDRLLNDSSSWVSIDDDKQLYHEEFPQFTIHVVEEHYRKFQEDWTDRFSDISASELNIELRYFGTVLRKEKFVSCDGGRYRIPKPKIEMTSGKTIFYLESDSIAYKVSNIYDQYYPLKTALMIADIQIR